MTLLSDTAYHSFIGEVEALNTTTIRRLTPLRRHQLLAIAREGATASEVLNYLSREFGMAVRPNHLGMALQRHRRAGRLDNRDQRWHLPRSA